VATRLFAAVALSLAGCVTPPTPRCEPLVKVETVRVEVPVPVRRAPPPELLEPYRPAELPEFVPACTQGATSALTPRDEKRLKALLDGYVTRDAAWRSWAAEDAPPAPTITPAP
jgi:hypothetical protein